MGKIEAENPLEESMLLFEAGTITSQEFMDTFRESNVYIPQRTNQFADSNGVIFEAPFVQRHEATCLTVYSSQTQLASAAPSPFFVVMKGHALMELVSDDQTILLNPYGPCTKAIRPLSPVKKLDDLSSSDMK